MRTVAGNMMTVSFHTYELCMLDVVVVVVVFSSSHYSSEMMMMMLLLFSLPLSLQF